MNTRTLVLLGTTLASLASNAPAQIDFGDIAVRPNTAGTQVQTGLVDEFTGDVTMGIRVFNATLDPDLHFTNEPGLDSGPDQWAFPSQIGFTIRAALRKWNGTDFSTIPSEQIQIKLGPLGPVLTPLIDSPVTGFSMAVSSDGEFHHHPGYTLLTSNSAAPSDGIYLYQATLWSTISGIAESKPFFILFNQNAPASDQDTAHAWVTNNLFGCPSDFNNDGFVTGDDFDAFVAAFELGDLTADFNNDSFVTGDDFDAFVQAFMNGC